MGQSNNSKPKPIVTEMDSSPSSRILLSSLRALSNDILLNIFLMLDVWSIGAVLKTCKHFKLIIYGSNIKIFITINYIASWINVLDTERVRDLMYLLEFKFRNLGLPFSLEFKPVDPKRKTESSSGYSVNVLLWVEQHRVTDEALQSLRWFISEYSQTPILLLKGDSIFSKDKELLQKVRELHSLKVLGVIDGSLKCWSELQTFNELELVYFATTKEYRIDKKKFVSIASTTVCTISTQETTFIMNVANIGIIHCSDNLE
jgi:hypothetical protein